MKKGAVRSARSRDGSPAILDPLGGSRVTPRFPRRKGRWRSTTPPLPTAGTGGALGKWGTGKRGDRVPPKPFQGPAPAMMMNSRQKLSSTAASIPVRPRQVSFCTRARASLSFLPSLPSLSPHPTPTPVSSPLPLSLPHPLVPSVPLAGNNKVGGRVMNAVRPTWY